MRHTRPQWSGFPCVMVVEQAKQASGWQRRSRTYSKHARCRSHRLVLQELQNELHEHGHMSWPPPSALPLSPPLPLPSPHPPTRKLSVAKSLSFTFASTFSFAFVSTFAFAFTPPSHQEIVSRQVSVLYLCFRLQLCLCLHLCPHPTLPPGTCQSPSQCPLPLPLSLCLCVFVLWWFLAFAFWGALVPLCLCVVVLLLWFFVCVVLPPCGVVSLGGCRCASVSCGLFICLLFALQWSLWRAPP